MPSANSVRSSYRRALANVSTSGLIRSQRSTLLSHHVTASITSTTISGNSNRTVSTTATATASKATSLPEAAAARHHHNHHCRVQTAFKSSAAFADMPIPETVRDNLKAQVLDRASKKNGGVWVNEQSEGVNDEISVFHDPLDEWHLDRTTRYWPNLPAGVSSNSDPILLTQHELGTLSESIRNDLLGTDHPVLNKAASYFFGSADGGKKVRPMMVMLLSRALADTMEGSMHDREQQHQHQQQHQHRHNSANKLNTSHLNGNTSDATSSTVSLFTNPLSWQRRDLPKAQRRIAEISEMIHTASLFHDDVIDDANTRRGKSAVHVVFGNKMAILAGDYLLARATMYLARLRNVQVVEIMSLIIENLVRGEVMQMRGTASSEGKNERLDYYLRKNYYKTSSLMAHSCMSAATLAQCPSPLVRASYEYGKFVGMAFQLVDDVLDFEGSISSLGKPALSDLNSGLATGPVLFAAEQFPELNTLMDRKFKHDGDVERATELVFQSDGIERTKQLAQVHAELAMEAALQLDESSHRDALINLAYKVVSRTK